MKDAINWEQNSWAYDIDTYERCKRMVERMDSIVGHNLNRGFWVDRANAVAKKYPNVGLVVIK